MIVIFLIGLIGSVIGYNVKGSKEGKAFRSEQGIAKLKDILQMEIASGVSTEDIVDNPKYLKRTGLVTDANKLLKDGWGQPYLISQDGEYDISVKSIAWDRHKEKEIKSINLLNPPMWYDSYEGIKRKKFALMGLMVCLAVIGLLGAVVGIRGG